MKRFLRMAVRAVVIGLVVIIALIVCALVLHAMFARPWIEPVPGVRLEPSRPILREAEVKPDSAVDLLRRAEAAMPPGDLHEDEIKKLLLVPPNDEQRAKLESLVSANGEALALARQEGVSTNPQMVTMESFDAPIRDFNPAMKLSRLLRLSATCSALREDWPAAFGECVAAMRLDDSLSRGSVLIHRLVEITSEARTCALVRWLALEHAIPGDSAQTTIDAVLRLDLEMEPWNEVYRWERLPALRALRGKPKTADEQPVITHLFDNPSATTRLFEAAVTAIPAVGRLFGSNPTVTSRNFDTLYTHLIALAEQPYSSAAMHVLEKQFEIPDAFPGIFQYRDAVGRLNASISMPVFAKMSERHCIRIADLCATAVVLAIRQYEQTNHHAPASLDELVPQWLPSVPTDPFDGKPFRYLVKKNGWVVYSVGPNQQDEHGLVPEKKATADKPGDLVYPSTEAVDERAKLVGKAG